MGGVDIAIAVEQEIGGYHRRLQRLAGAGIGLTGLIEQPGHIAQITGHVGACVRGLGDPPAPVRPPRAEISGAKQCGDSSGSVTTLQHPLCHLLKHPGDLLVGSRRRLGEMPCLPIRLIRGQFREDPMGSSAFSLCPRARRLRPGSADGGRPVARDLPSTSTRLARSAGPRSSSIRLASGPCTAGYRGPRSRRGRRAAAGGASRRAGRRSVPRTSPAYARSAAGPRQRPRRGVLRLAQRRGQLEQRQRITLGLSQHPGA